MKVAAGGSAERRGGDDGCGQHTATVHADSCHTGDEDAYLYPTASPKVARKENEDSLPTTNVMEVVSYQHTATVHADSCHTGDEDAYLYPTASPKVARKENEDSLPTTNVMEVVSYQLTATTVTNTLNRFPSELTAEERNRRVHHPGEVTAAKRRSHTTGHHPSEVTAKHKSHATGHHLGEITAKHKSHATGHHPGEITTKHKSHATGHHPSEVTAKHKSHATGHHPGEITAKHKSHATGHHPGEAVTAKRRSHTAKGTTDGQQFDNDLPAHLDSEQTKAKSVLKSNMLPACPGEIKKKRATADARKVSFRLDIMAETENSVATSDGYASCCDVRSNSASNHPAETCVDSDAHLIPNGTTDSEPPAHSHCFPALNLSWCPVSKTGEGSHRRNEYQVRLWQSRDMHVAFEVQKEPSLSPAQLVDSICEEPDSDVYDEIGDQDNTDELERFCDADSVGQESSPDVCNNPPDFSPDSDLIDGDAMPAPATQTCTQAQEAVQLNACDIDQAVSGSDDQPIYEIDDRGCSADDYSRSLCDYCGDVDQAVSVINDQPIYEIDDRGCSADYCSRSRYDYCGDVSNDGYNSLPDDHSHSLCDYPVEDGGAVTAHNQVWNTHAFLVDSINPQQNQVITLNDLQGRHSNRLSSHTDSLGGDLNRVVLWQTGCSSPEYSEYLELH